MKEMKGKKPGFVPGVDNDRIVDQIVAITELDEHHAKVRRQKDGSLRIISVSEKTVS